MQQLSEFKAWLITGLGLTPDNSWLVALATVLLATLIAVWLVRRIFDKLASQLEKTRNVWDDLLLIAARKPVVMLVWLLGANLALALIDSQTEYALLKLVNPLREVAVLVLIAWFLTRFIRRAEMAMVEERVNTRLDATTVSAFGKLLRLVIVIAVALVVLQSLGYSVSGVLAFGGIGGIAVGFAAKDLLANFFGGLMIYMDRPFKVGDWIRSPDKEIEGVVEDIGWRLTRIRTFDQRPLYVPNATFTSLSVENPSRMLNRQIYEVIGVRYCDLAKLKSILAKVREMLEQHPDIATELTLMVNLNKLADSSLEFFIYGYTRTTNWQRYHQVKEDVLLQVMEIIEASGAEVAFPTQTLELHYPQQMAGAKNAGPELPPSIGQ